MKPTRQLKLHRNLANAIIEALKEVFVNNKYADKVIPNLLQTNKKWGARDRRTIAFISYEICRNWRLLCYCAYVAPIDEPSELWHVLGAYLHLKHQIYPKWEEFMGIDYPTIDQRYQQAQQLPDLLHSIPEWLHLKASKELPDVWPQLLPSLNTPNNIILRANTLKCSVTQLQQALLLQNISSETIANTPNALKITSRGKVKHLTIFKKGWFEIQDAASQEVGRFLHPKVGSFVIDACAGAGGKTLHLAALMQNKGQILSLDVVPNKLKELHKRCQRAGVSMVKQQHIPLQNPMKQLKPYLGKADYLLLDVPCSGLGTLRRKMDIKWKLQAHHFKKLYYTQQFIIHNYSQLLKVGGTMVYATCSILPSENEKQVQRFLQNHPNFTLQEEKTLYPHTFGYDGFYMAKLVKQAAL